MEADLGGQRKPNVGAKEASLGVKVFFPGLSHRITVTYSDMQVSKFSYI